MIEVIRDPVLFAKLRKDVQTAVVVDTETGKQTFDLQTLMNLPLLASVYAESMRLHVSINITRKVHADMELGGYHLKKGSLVQSPSSICHLDEKHWARPGHPADKFWAERFIVYEEENDATGEIKTVPKFSMTGHTGNWFPYGLSFSCLTSDFIIRLFAIILIYMNRWRNIYLRWKTLREARDHECCSNAGTTL
jgi:hypothetical protein